MGLSGSGIFAGKGAVDFDQHQFAIAQVESREEAVACVGKRPTCWRDLNSASCTIGALSFHELSSAAVGRISSAR